MSPYTKCLTFAHMLCCCWASYAWHHRKPRGDWSFRIWTPPIIIFSKQRLLPACICVFPRTLICATASGPNRGCVTLSVQRVFLHSSCSTPFPPTPTGTASKSQDRDVCVELREEYVTCHSVLLGFSILWLEVVGVFFSSFSLEYSDSFFPSRAFRNDFMTRAQAKDAWGKTVQDSAQNWVT